MGFFSFLKQNRTHACFGHSWALAGFREVQNYGIYIVLSLSLEACCWEASEGWRGLSCALTQGPSSGVSGNLELWMVQLNPVLTTQTHKAQPCHNWTVWIKSVLLRGQGTLLDKYQSLSSDCFPPCQPGADPSITTKDTYSILMEKEVCLPPTESPMPHPNTCLWPYWASN